MERRARLLAELSGMRTWRDFERVMDVPVDLMPAITTGRSELVTLAKPRALTEVECKTLYEMIGVLIDTNQRLREHAQEVALLAKAGRQQLLGGFKNLDHLVQFASFDDGAEA